MAILQTTAVTGSLIVSASAGIGLRIYGGASGSFSGSFYGSGANLTGLSISGLTSGILSLDRGGMGKDMTTLASDRLFYRDADGIIQHFTSSGLVYNDKANTKVATYKDVVDYTLVRIVNDVPLASIIKDDGTNVGINATPGTYRLTVGGDLGVTGTVYETSTIKIKKNIESLTDELSKIIQTRPVEFDYIENGVHSYGFIAQELNEIYPDTVIKDDNGETIGVAYADLTSPIMRAIQQLSEKIDNLTKRVEELENK